MCDGAHLFVTCLYSRPFESCIHGEEFDMAKTLFRPSQRANYGQRKRNLYPP